MANIRSALGQTRLHLPQQSWRQRKGQSATRLYKKEQGLVPPSEAECLKVAAEGSLLVLRVLGIGKIGFCCKKILPGQETVRPQTSQDPTIQHMTKSQDAAAVVLRKK